jgi:hypothetical protein
MKLKCVRGPRPGQKTMVCLTSKGAFKWEVGQTHQIPDEAGHEILAKWKQCFAEVKTKPKPAPEAKSESSPETKMMAAPENK